jgi:Ca2+-binding EF-hand superfamily protein
MKHSDLVQNNLAFSADESEELKEIFFSIMDSKTKCVNLDDFMQTIRILKLHETHPTIAKILETVKQDHFANTNTKLINFNDFFALLTKKLVIAF